MKFIFFTIFFNLTFLLIGQNRYYFTSFWYLTDESNASYYREGEIDTTNIFFINSFVDYRINGSKLQEGRYNEQGKKEGQFSVYYDDGKIYSQGKYQNNIPVGLWKFYYPTGQIRHVVNFSDDPFTICESYDSLGTSLIKEGTGYWEEYFLFGKVSGYQNNHHREGVWKISLPNGVVLVQETYVDGTPLGNTDPRINYSLFSEYIPNYLIEELNSHNATINDYPSIKSLPTLFQKRDSSEVYTKVNQMPTPRFNEYQFQNFVQSNLKYQEKGVFASQRQVYVQIYINELGNVYKTHLVRGIGPKYDEEAERVLLLTKWIPGYHNGVPVKTTKGLNLSFYVN